MNAKNLKTHIGATAIADALTKNGLLISAPQESLYFSHISYDSRDVEAGTLFICKGNRFKEEYLHHAIGNGAVCYVSEEAFDVPLAAFIVTDVLKAMAIIAREAFGEGLEAMTTIAVTGSKGKTTTTQFIFQALSNAFDGKAAYTSTTGYYDGTEHGEHPNHNTTMESLDTYRVMRKAFDSGVRYFVIEASSQAAIRSRIYGMHFDYGVFTNIGADHISPNEHKTFEEYLGAKVSIMAQCDTVILNEGLLKEHPKIIESLEGIRIFTFGRSESSDFRYSDARENEDGIYVFHLRDKTQMVQSHYTLNFSMFGDYNVMNASAAAGVCLFLGVSQLQMNEAFVDVAIEGRSDFIEGFICPVCVDYAHNAISATAFVAAIAKEYPDRHIKAVFGCPGSKAVNRRKDMAQIVGAVAEHIYITEEDEGYEEFSDIAKQIIEYLPEGVSYTLIEDRKAAIERALSEASEDDFIAILGKGDEKTFSRRGVVRAYKGDVFVASDFIEEYREAHKEDLPEEAPQEAHKAEDS